MPAQRQYLDAPKPGTWLVGGIASTLRPGQRATKVTFAWICRRSPSTACGARWYREVQRCVRCGCGLWDEQEGVLPGRLVLCKMCLVHPLLMSASRFPCVGCQRWVIASGWDHSQRARACIQYVPQHWEECLPKTEPAAATATHPTLVTTAPLAFQNHSKAADVTS